MPASKIALTANFVQVDYAVTISTSPVAGGTTTGSGTANFGDVVAISATPETGYQFVEWTGDSQYLDTPTAVAANLTVPVADVNLTANFDLVTSISQTDEQRPRVWPNPFDDKINIGNIENIDRIVIVLQTGQILIEKTDPGSEIRTSQFAPGIYIIKIIDENGTVSLNKLIKR